MIGWHAVKRVGGAAVGSAPGAAAGAAVGSAPDVTVTSAQRGVQGGAKGAAHGAPGALSGVRVLDLSRVLAGPYLTMLLADLGADVIKVERPGGDDTRYWGPPHYEGEATYFLSVNRNKRSVVLNLADDADRDHVLALASDVDVVIENFRPGVADRLGVGYDALRALNPGLIYCSITAFGDAPQARTLPGYDLLVQAMGGLMSVTGTEESGPVKAGVALVDVLAGVHGAVGVLAALRHRERTGEGQRVEVSLLGTVLASLVNQAQAYLCTGESPKPAGNAHPSIVPYQTLRTADGSIAIAVGNDRQFADLCTALGLDLAADPRYATNPDRVRNRDALIATLEAALADQASGDVVARLLASGVPAGPVNDLAGAFATAADLGLEPVITVSAAGRTVLQVASPLKLSRTPVRYVSPPPRLPEYRQLEHGQQELQQREQSRQFQQSPSEGR